MNNADPGRENENEEEDKPKEEEFCRKRLALGPGLSVFGHFAHFLKCVSTY